jgi:hypothetical protein
VANLGETAFHSVIVRFAHNDSNIAIKGRFLRGGTSEVGDDKTIASMLHGREIASPAARKDIKFNNSLRWILIYLLGQPRLTDRLIPIYWLTHQLIDYFLLDGGLEVKWRIVRFSG